MSNTQLDRIQDWLPLAQRSGWSVTGLAKICGVSARTLERHFQKTHGTKPKQWLMEQRQKLALELLQTGFSIKETAVRLGYHYVNHFSREFKSYWGLCPKTAQTAPVRGVCNAD